MNLVVCGDSFMSADTTRPNTHFSELLENYGHTVTNLARGGISNTGIAFQLDKASRLNPDAIVFSSTTHDRIDLVVGKFDPLKGLENFIYPYPSDSSTGSKHVGDLDAAIQSDLIISFLSNRLDLPFKLQNRLTPELAKQYVAQFHDENFKKILDTWLIGYWKYRLTERRIPFVHLYQGGVIGQYMYNYVKNNPKMQNQCVYHTDRYTQILMAEELNIELNKVVIL